MKKWVFALFRIVCWRDRFLSATQLFRHSLMYFVIERRRKHSDRPIVVDWLMMAMGNDDDPTIIVHMTRIAYLGETENAHWMMPRGPNGNYR